MSVQIILGIFEPFYLALMEEEDRLFKVANTSKNYNSEEWEKFSAYSLDNNMSDMGDLSLTYLNWYIKQSRSRSLKNFRKRNREKFLLNKQTNKFLFPYKRLKCFSSRDLKLKKSWYNKKITYTLLDSKADLLNFMKNFLKEESHRLFEEEFVECFIEDKMFVEIAW